MTHRQRCEAECTRDVIFLFQVRIGRRAGHDVKKWKTEGVWLDRAEAEAWGKSQRHNFGEKGIGWQVYGVPTEGELARMLKDHSPSEAA